MEFDFIIVYRPRTENANADGLSRQAWPEEDELLDKESIVKLPRFKKEEENKKMSVPSGVPYNDGHHLSAR